MKIALQFSGGVDSLACLWLVRNTPDLTVYWGKTDGAYEDMEDYVRKVCTAAKLPLKIVHGDRGIEEHGYPSDLIPDQVFACCSRGLWEPMRKEMIVDGIEVVVRGQRKDDVLKAPIESGYRDDQGIIYLFPIYDWSRLTVMDYLMDTIPQLIHPCYGEGEPTGRDCWDCTGYLFDNAQRILNLPDDKRAFILQKLGGQHELA